MLWDFCDLNDGANWDTMEECTPPCEMGENSENDARCKAPEEPEPPEEERRRRRLLAAAARAQRRQLQRLWQQRRPPRL